MLRRKFLPFLDTFCEAELTFGNFADRKEAARNFHQAYKHQLKDITLVADSTPIKINWRSGEENKGEEGTYCHKVRGPGIFSELCSYITTL